jgi:hypothetical protein
LDALPENGGEEREKSGRWACRGEGCGEAGEERREESVRGWWWDELHHCIEIVDRVGWYGRVAS